MRIRAFVAMACASVFAGCGIVDIGGVVEVRLRNASLFTLSEATLYTSEGPFTHTDVGPGAATPYVEVETAYRIATTQVVVDQDTLRLQVIDFVGEEPLADGRYSYVLTFGVFDGRPVSVSQELRKDP